MSRLVSAFIRTTIIALPMLSAASAQQSIGTCRPISERKQERGCWILADAKIGRLDQPAAYWHLDRYASRAAAERAKDAEDGGKSVVAESFGKAWLLSIGPADWRPRIRGKHVASIGPLHIEPGKEYSAQFMEATMKPGDTSAVHRHSGPEAWYTISGTTCLETPTERIVGTRDHPAIVPEGPPMALKAIGTELRRSIVLILHDASRPPTMIAHDWRPTGLCKS